MMTTAVSLASLVFVFLTPLPYTCTSCTLKKVIEDVATTVASEAVTLLMYNEDSTSEIIGLKKCRPKDCADICHEGHAKSGVYQVWPRGWKSCGIKVFCDMEKDAGGWTVIQRRGDFGKPKDYFYRRWREYQFGFGNISEDFWLGNEQIMHISDQDSYELRVDLVTKDGEAKYAAYSEFFIENEASKYKLHIHGYSGDAGDSLSPHHGHAFTTQDRDNDIYEKNCAVEFKGAWWYNKCHSSNLNGLYLNGPHESFADGVTWYNWKGHKFSYRDVVIKIRPKRFISSRKSVCVLTIHDKIKVI